MKVPSLLIRGCGFVVLLMAALWAGPVAAATCTSTSDGTWEQTGGTTTWDCGIPGPADDVIIAHDIEVTGDIQVTSLTINGGATLTGTSGEALSVSGNWTNLGGSFVHNGMEVNLNGSTGTQTISGATHFNRLNTLNGSNKDFADSSITIEDGFYHTGGSMLGGTSTFTFIAAATISGGSLKRFHHMVIAGDNVRHTSGEVRVSGDLTVTDLAQLSFIGSALKIFRFNGTTAQTVTLVGSAVAGFAQLSIDPGATVILPDLGNTNQPTAAAVTNNGVLRQSGVATTSTNNEYVYIEDSTAVVVYRGLDLAPTSGTLNATVGIGGNRTNCLNPGGYDHRNRCFGVKNNDATAATANVTLYTTAAEDDITDDRFYEYSGGTTWTDRGVCPTGDGDACTANGIVIEPGNNHFLIGTNTPPTPVTLTSFIVTRVDHANHLAWETATEINFAGFYVQRRADDGDFARVGDFVYAQGGPLSGASYTWTDTDLDGGPYHYRLEAVDFDQSIEFFEPTGVEETMPNAGFSLYLPFSFK